MSLLLLIGAVVATVAGLLLARRTHRRQELLSPLTAATIAGLVLALLVGSAAVIGWDVPALKGFDYRGGIKIMPELAALIAALTLYNAAFKIGSMSCRARRGPYVMISGVAG